jgi:hypothetical protein
VRSKRKWDKKNESESEEKHGKKRWEKWRWAVT